MRQWIIKGKMDSYWVSPFYFPQGFMTAVLQTYARKMQDTPIDQLVFKTIVREWGPDAVEEVPEDGVNIHGMILQGCGWDTSKQLMKESDRKVLFVDMPCIW